ncbi:MAG: hypothetical protein JKY95_14965 [Planctomycetaceae bacterium]|nr:hypothetical protein [Planctomycetaceae bacterium]
MSNKNPQNQPAIAPFKTRLWAVGSLYLTNKITLGIFIWLTFMVLNSSFLGTIGQNSQSQQEQSAIQSAEMGLESIKKARVHYASRGFKTEKDKSHRVHNAEQRLIQAKQAYQEAKERRRQKLLNEDLLLILGMVVCALATLFASQLRPHFFNSRLTMIPGFLLPHIIVAFGLIAISLALVSGFMQYWYGASFWACFSLAFFLVGIFIYGINFSTRLLGLLIYPIIPVFYLHYYIRAEFFGYYMDGQYPWLTTGLFLFALLMLVLNIRSLIRLSEEDIDYTISASWDEYFERIKSRFRSLRLKYSRGFATPNKNSQNQPAIAPFKTRLWAVSRLYLTNNVSLSWMILLTCILLIFPFLASDVGQNSDLRKKQSAFQSAQQAIEFYKGIEVGVGIQGSESEQEKSQRLDSAEKTLIQAEQSYREAKKLRRKKTLNKHSSSIMVLVVFALIHMFAMQFKSQFFNSRATLIPGFLQSHLVAGLGAIVIILAVVSGVMWCWFEISFWAYFSLAASLVGIFIYGISFSTRLLGLLLFPMIIAGYLNYYILSAYLGNYLDGQYPVFTAGMLLFALYVLALNIRSLYHLSEEDPDYHIPPPWKEYFGQIKLSSSKQSLKDSSGNMNWGRTANDWLFQFFQDRVTAGTLWNRVWHWQTSRGGQAVMLLGIFFSVAIVLAIVVLFDLHILNAGQFVQIWTGLLFYGLVGFSMVMLFSWVRHSSKLGSEIIRPMARLQFVKSLILTHLLEVSLLAVPVWLGSLLYFWIYHPDQGIVVSIISICCAVIYVCLFPWIISFRSMIAVCGFYSIIFSVVLPMNMFLRRSGIQEIQFSIGQQCLLLVCSLCVGLLLLADTKRRWMNTEFGR